MNQQTKVRTTGELSVLLESLGAFIAVMALVTLMFARHTLGVIIAIAVPITYGAFVWLIVQKKRNAFMINIIDSDGVKNSSFGNTLCEMDWREIGDFGVAEVTKGLFSGRYIYMSRIFVPISVRGDIIKNYDPRVCIVFPYTEDICRAVSKASGGKIDIR